MPTIDSTNKSRYRRFWRLFRREKSSPINVSYSYQYMMRFPRLPITVPPVAPTLMSYRWNDEDDCEPLPKKLSRINQHQQHLRRRLPKRYSDIVGPSSAKLYLPEKGSVIQEKQTLSPLSKHHHHRHNNLNEGLYNKKSNKTADEKREHPIVTRRYSSKNRRLSTIHAVDVLAHRMQAAMSVELMHSLDRNFVFGDKKQLINNSHINRSHSLHVQSSSSSNDWWENSLKKQHYYHIIPRVKHTIDDEQKSIETIPSVDELTPDYDEEFIIRPVKHDDNESINEEPIADYDDHELEEQSAAPPASYDLEVSSSHRAPHISLTPSCETCTQEEPSIPPTPPPLPNTTIIEQKKTTIRCRTIADKISTDHKLILKDTAETTTINIVEKKQSVPRTPQQPPRKLLRVPSIAPAPCYLHLSKELLEKTTLRKVSHPVSRSYSTYGSMSQLNDHDTELTTLREKSSIIDEQQPQDGLSSSATTSIVIENEYEHRSSSKIYNDYKRRASLINVPTNHSAIIHPMHTHIGLRSSTSSSSNNDKSNDITSSNKQMNMCVINQLNQHLSTRFHKQQQDICVTTKTNTTNHYQSYDQVSDDAINNSQTNLYDEPQHIEIKKCPDLSTSSVPPPPPPLPVGGFRPVVNRPPSSQRTSVMTLPREINGCSTGTSTTSSKLSDTRILRELRTNPLFTKAKQHLEVPSDSNPSVPYVNLNTCSKSIVSTTEITTTNIESISIRQDESNTRSMNSQKNRINSRTFTKTQRRQSELELIFQKRAQRIEQNLS